MNERRSFQAPDARLRDARKFGEEVQELQELLEAGDCIGINPLIGTQENPRELPPDRLPVSGRSP